MQAEIFDYRAMQQPESQQEKVIETNDNLSGAEPDDAGTDLVVLKSIVPADVFKEGGSEPLLKMIEKEIESFVPDVTTPAGRKEIASMAYKVTKSKTFLDKAGKELGEDYFRRKQAIDEERRKVRERLDALKEKVREPLTRYENMEKERVEGHTQAIAQISALSSTEYFHQNQIRDALNSVQSFSGRDWQEFKDKADIEIKKTVELLEFKLADRIRIDEKAAEDERLKKEADAKAQAEREARIAQEAADAAKKEAEQKAKEEADRVAAEQKRLEQEKADAEARAQKAEADRIAAEKKAEADKIAAAEQAKKDAEAAAQAERDKIAAQKKADEDAEKKRQEDLAHRGKINREARDDIMLALDDGYSEADAEKIIAAIAFGRVRNVKIIY